MKKKKLQLNKETIASLNINQMSLMKGGGESIITYMHCTCDSNYKVCPSLFIPCNPPIPEEATVGSCACTFTKNSNKSCWC